MPTELRAHWTLDPDVTFLNHGSFGACPRPVLAAQERLRAELEREPVRFFSETLEPALDAARAEVARFVGARPEDFVFVRNSTTGVNAALRCQDLKPGDELLVTDHAYEPCRNALDHVASRASATVRVARIPLPIGSPGDVTDRILSAVTPRTRLALIDHVTSQTGLVFPIEEIVRELAARNVETLVDGAHAPGMLDLDVTKIGAAYYAGNFHKWVCAPKGAAMLVVRDDRKTGLHPTVVSRGFVRASSRPRLWQEFDWTGTDDPTAFLSVPSAIAFLGGLLPGGWEGVRTHNRSLALRARETLQAALGVPELAPAEMIGSLADVRLPDGSCVELQDRLRVDHRIQVPIFAWPSPPHRLVRVSAHVYNAPHEYDRLAHALGSELSVGGSVANE